MNTILLIATHKYKQFLKQAIKGIEDNWEDFDINIFTDEINPLIPYAQFRIDHKPFPYPTIMRFKFFNKYKRNISGDRIYYVDVDARFVRNIALDGELIATRHCGYYFDGIEKLQKDVYEKNRHSVFFGYKFKKYFGGGFYGGTRERFFDLCKWCETMIDGDLTNGITPIHHDETALNAYLMHVPPTVELSPEYHYPENSEDFIERCWKGNDFTPKLLLLKKNHEEIRA